MFEEITHCTSCGADLEPIVEAKVRFHAKTGKPHMVIGKACPKWIKGTQVDKIPVIGFFLSGTDYYRHDKYTVDQLPAFDNGDGTYEVNVDLTHHHIV